MNMPTTNTHTHTHTQTNIEQQEKFNTYTRFVDNKIIIIIIIKSKDRGEKFI